MPRITTDRETDQANPPMAIPAEKEAEALAAWKAKTSETREDDLGAPPVVRKWTGVRFIKKGYPWP